jgi:hypothetical protein
VMNHEWSRKMDQDIEFVHPHTKQLCVFQAWTLYKRESEKAINDAAEQYARYWSAEQSYDDTKFVPYGWTMPHLKFDGVKKMLNAVKKMQQPYLPHVTGAVTVGDAVATGDTEGVESLRVARAGGAQTDAAELMDMQ